MDERVCIKITSALRGLARVDAFEFCQSPTLRASYLRSIRRGRRTGGTVYVSDPETCGLPDCWSTWRGLTERYGLRAERAPQYQQRFPLDCEDIAAAHAGYLSATGVGGVFMGFIPGEEISHAVCGVRDKRGAIMLMDPAVWAGMGPFGRPYGPRIYWAEV